MIFDHLVLIVDDLAAASRHFSSLGFTVIPGGEHPAWGTHNALIGLEDGSYLELLAATRPRQAAAYRLLTRFGVLSLATTGKQPFHKRFIRHLAAGEGIADFALFSDDLENDLKATRSRGLEVAGPFEGSRRRTDGVKIAWRSASPESAILPFLIEDVTPREQRVPSGIHCQHANGVTGVVRLTIACLDLQSSVSQYRRLLGFPEENQGKDEESVCFRLNGHDLALSNAQPNVAMRKRAVVPHSISLRSSKHSRPLILQFSAGQLLRP